MNNERRNRISKLIGQLEDINNELQTLLEEEQDAFDNMPESLQESERGQQSQDAISNLENCDLSDIISSLEDARA